MLNFNLTSVLCQLEGPASGVKRAFHDADILARISVLRNAGLTKVGGAVASGCSMQGSTKQPYQKYFMTNYHKSLFH